MLILPSSGTGQGTDDNKAVKGWDRCSGEWWEATMCPGSSGQVATRAKTGLQSPGEWLVAAWAAGARWQGRRETWPPAGVGWGGQAGAGRKYQGRGQGY